MNAFFEEIELGFTDTHLSIHFEKALSCVIERVVADGLKLQILGVASEQVQSFRLGLLGVTLVHRWSGPLFFVVNDFTAALVEVHIEKDHLLQQKQTSSVSKLVAFLYRGSQIY